MLRISQLSKHFGDVVVLDGVSFIVNDGDRVGLVGPNGAGKTTLLRLIADLDALDGGSISRQPPALSIGYLHQALIFAPDATVGDVLAEGAATWRAAREEVDRLAAALATDSSGDTLARYGDALLAAA